MEQGLDTLGCHVIAIDSAGWMEFATDGAKRMLGDPCAVGRGLPEDLRARVARLNNPN